MVEDITTNSVPNRRRETPDPDRRPRSPAGHGGRRHDCLRDGLERLQRSCDNYCGEVGRIMVGAGGCQRDTGGCALGVGGTGCVGGGFDLRGCGHRGLGNWGDVIVGGRSEYLLY